MKNIKTFFLLIMFFCFINNVNADCDSRTRLEINTASSNVTADYSIDYMVTDYDGIPHPEISEELTEDLESGYILLSYITLNISNITDKIYFEIINEDEGVDLTYYANDLKDGKFSYQVPDTMKIRNYKIKIFSNVDECKDEELRTIPVTTPMYNEYSTSSLCQNNDVYYCKKFVTTPITVDFDKLIEEERRRLMANNNETSKNKNIFTIIGIITCVLLIVGIIILIIRNKKNNIKAE